MRTIEDHAGITWDVAVGKESYGSMMLLFSRRDGREVRRVGIAASTRLEAERILHDFDPDALRAELQSAASLDESSPADY